MFYMKYLSFVSFFVLLQFSSYSQVSEKGNRNIKRVELSDLVKELLSKDTIPVVFSDVVFYGDGDLYQYALKNIPNVELSSDSLIIIKRKITLSACKVESNLDWKKFWFQNTVELGVSTHFPEFYSEGGNEDLMISTVFMSIDSSIFDKGLTLNFSGKQPFVLFFNKNTVREDFAMFQHDGYSGGVTMITGCNFKLTSEDSYIISSDVGKVNLQRSRFTIFTNDLTFEFSNNIIDFKFNSDSKIPAWIDGKISSKAVSTILVGNKFESNIDLKKDSDSLFFYKNFEIKIDQEAKAVSLSRNDFQVSLAISLGQNLDALKIYDNKFSNIGFGAFRIPNEDNTIYWSDLTKGKVGLKTLEYGNRANSLGFYKAHTEKQISDLLSYKDLTKMYKKFYDAYKTNGDIKSANQVFVEIKDLEARRLKYEYKLNPDFNTFFQIKINQLLKFYTVYGTDPARALVISFWLLLIFAIFYFFFPSTWDLTSKSRLINDFKLLIEKNEHGYFKPFLKLLIGFFISLLNALTLSLNSFVTLGFGEIPTKGLARYVTIIQGFIGWFLLSLFTVALLNQVIF